MSIRYSYFFFFNLDIQLGEKKDVSLFNKNRPDCVERKQSLRKDTWHDGPKAEFKFPDLS